MVESSSSARRASEGRDGCNRLQQPGGRRFVETGTHARRVSPSGLKQALAHPSHGSRRGLPSDALRAEESTFRKPHSEVEHAQQLTDCDVTGTMWDATGFTLSASGAVVDVSGATYIISGATCDMSGAV